MQSQLHAGGDDPAILSALDERAARATNSDIELVNRAGESKSPYVRAHQNNPVAWQLWETEAIELAKATNKLLFVSIGYNACHWCHVMERESFENEEIASILNSEFIPIKVDREERPDIDRIYMNFVQATTGSGGWPLNVFITPDLEPLFGGTYWPGPNSTTARLPLEEQVDFLSILKKLSDVWRDQESRCRQDAAQILKQLKDFAAEGTLAAEQKESDDSLDIELLEEAYQNFSTTFDSTNGGFGGAPKFPTPSKLSFLLRLGHYPKPVIDVVGEKECAHAQYMAIATLRKMARGGIRDHIGHGFARYSVTADWSLPHFEKMLYDNAQLLHVYLDAFLATHDPELLGVVYSIALYLTKDALAAPDGCFYASEDADSIPTRGDTGAREGAFYVWTSREFETILGDRHAEICSAFWGVHPDGNVSPENDTNDEFINQNVLSVVSTPKALATQFGMTEAEVISVLKQCKQKLRKHRDEERPRPALDDKIIAGWNGIAIGALARTAAALESFDPESSKTYLLHAMKAASFIHKNLYDEQTNTLYRVYRNGRGDTPGFADDYAYLIDGLLDLYDATFDEFFLKWANNLQLAQIERFYDAAGGGFFSTTKDAPHTILRLKDGMDTAEPSTNGVSASNLLCLASLLPESSHDFTTFAKRTLAAFESEILQYPWLFSSFMPGIVASHLGTTSILVKGEGEVIRKRIESEHLKPRGGLSTLVKVQENMAQEASWFGERNTSARELAKEGLKGQKILICEDQKCREESLDQSVGEPIDLGLKKDLF